MAERPVSVSEGASTAGIAARLRWAPAVGLVVYAAVLAVHLPALTRDVYWNSDIATPLAVGDGLSRRVVHPRIGIQQAAYTWAADLTRHLPGWLTLWRVVVPVSLLAAVLVLAWTVRRCAGAWGGLVALALAVAAPPLVLLDEVAPVFHGWAMATAVLMGALLVALCHGSHLPWRLRTVAACGAVALLAGVVMATDVLLLVIGVAPLAAAGLLLAWRRHGVAARRVALAAVSVCVAAGIVAGAVQLLMHRAGYSTGLPPAGGASFAAGAIGEHLRVLLRGLFDLGDGLPAGASSDLQPAAAVLAAALVLAACAAVVLAVRAVTAEDAGGREADARFAHCMFWCIGALLLLGSFVLANVVLGAGGDTPPSARLVSPERYLTPLWFCVAAVAPLAGTSVLRKAAIGVTGAVWCLASALAVQIAADAHSFRPANTQGLEDVATVLQTRGVTHGYASYWDAYALTVQSGFAVTALPAAEGSWCGGAADAVCPHIDNGTISWYTLTPGPSFVLVDPQIDYLRDPPPPSLGTPVAVLPVGHFTVYLYGDDVRARFAATCSGRADHQCV